MYKRTEKARKQRAEQKGEVVYLGAQTEHPRDRFRKKQKLNLKKRQMRSFTQVLDLDILGTDSERQS